MWNTLCFEPELETVFLVSKVVSETSMTVANRVYTSYDRLKVTATKMLNLKHVLVVLFMMNICEVCLGEETQHFGSVGYQPITNNERKSSLSEEREQFNEGRGFDGRGEFAIIESSSLSYIIMHPIIRPERSEFTLSSLVSGTSMKSYIYRYISQPCIYLPKLLEEC